MNSDSPVPKAVLDALPLSRVRDGRALVRDGAVLKADAETVEGMQVVTGRVLNGDAEFSCWIGIEGGALDADCSCGAGEVCAHVSAVLLAAAGVETGCGTTVDRRIAADTGSEAQISTRSSRSPSEASSGGLVVVLDLEPDADGRERLTLAATRRSRIDGRWIETPYALDRARERRQPGYIEAVHLDWFRRALGDGVLSDDGARVTAHSDIDWLPGLIETLDCRWRSADGPRLKLNGTEAVPAVWLARADGAQRFQLQYAKHSGRILPGCPPLALEVESGACMALYAERTTAGFSAWLQGWGWVTPDVVGALREDMLERDDPCPDSLLPAPRKVLDLAPCAPAPVLSLEGCPAGPDGDPAPRAWAVPSFVYGEARLPAETAIDTVLLDPDRGEVARVRRDSDAEQAALRMLEKQHLKPMPEAGGAAARLSLYTSPSPRDD